MADPDLMTDVIDAMDRRFYGKYRGKVQDNNDPTGRGRLEVLVPAVMGETAVWALPCVPYAGENRGFYVLPERDAGVWVEFEAGDPSYPIWVGCFWADDQAPQNERGANATPRRKIIRSSSGLLIALDDDEQSLTLSSADGSNLLTIVVAEGQVKIQATAKVVLEAPQIELVANATHPIVFGDQLLQYLTQLVAVYQTHTHPGTSAPTSPMPPPTPQLLSFRVKAG